MQLFRAMVWSAFVVTTRVLVAQPGEVIVRGEVGARVDSFLTRAAMHGLSGSILVAKGGEVVLHKGYGLADREREARIGPNTPFSSARSRSSSRRRRFSASGRCGQRRRDHVERRDDRRTGAGAARGVWAAVAGGVAWRAHGVRCLYQPARADIAQRAEGASDRGVRNGKAGKPLGGRR